MINFKLKRFEYYDSLLGDNEECLNVCSREARGRREGGEGDVSDTIVRSFIFMLLAGDETMGAGRGKEKQQTNRPLGMDELHPQGHPRSTQWLRLRRVHAALRRARITRRKLRLLAGQHARCTQAYGT